MANKKNIILTPKTFRNSLFLIVGLYVLIQTLLFQLMSERLFLITAAINGLIIIILLYTILFYRNRQERFEKIEGFDIEQQSTVNLIQSSPEPIMLLDHTRIIYCNEKAVQILGYKSSKEIIGKDAMQFIHPTDQPLTLKRNELIYKGKELPPIDRRVITKGGDELTVEMTGKVIHFQGKDVMFISARDVTDRKRAETKAQHLATHDELTGLGNRRFFHLALEIRMKQNKPIALMIIDIDNFKKINDSLGHKVGDKVIQEFAKRVSKKIPADDIIARWGGDELAVIVSANTKDKVEKIANKVLQSFNSPAIIDDFKVRMNVSIGAAMCPLHTKTTEELIQNADLALFHRKKNGRNGFQLYTDEIGQAFHARLYLEQQLRKAVKDEDFKLHYQPRINAHTGKIHSVEALIRWDKATPDVFIPIAEENRLITKLGEWVLREACKQFKKWQSHCYPIRSISINLSVQQVHDEKHIERLIGIIEEEGLSCENIELEITENSISEDDSVISSLEKMKQKGTSIAVDDFGKEYSSLWRIKQLPVDTIKLDKLFIDAINKDEKANSIIETIVMLCKTLNLKIVAEGVEEKEQSLFLQQIGIHEMQGYYFSRPVKPETIQEYFKQDIDWIVEKEHHSRKSS
ncbi:sensor domain-containing protein [Salirhabdus salicampi]|uniref:sensor domain-containing protein n=1 Tax=Salirhabdus salicampi TaxID=476102 RepID=UPI0020C1E1AD|nr:EAL domain-containing protein [Salirhabdus salicampi]MCP8615745.1 EAL domain-containing protein [Salirhabdus salicampi]